MPVCFIIPPGLSVKSFRYRSMNLTTEHAGGECSHAKRHYAVWHRSMYQPLINLLPMSYKQRIDGELRQLFQDVEDKEISLDDAIEVIQRMLLTSFKSGIKTAEQDTERKTTQPEKVRRVASRS